MKSIFKQQVDKLEELYKEISKSYKWENNLKVYFMAFTYLQNNKNFSHDELESTNEYIKSKTKLFSGYADYQSSRILLATSLVNKFDNPNEQFDILLQQDDKLNRVGFKSNNYLPLANYALLTSSKNKNVDECIENAYTAYKNMREYHPFLTGYDDYPVCMLIATSTQDINSKIDKIEEYYKTLNEVGFYKGNSLQLLSHILSFSDEDIYTKATQCKLILNKLKENKMNLSTDYYSSLGMLALVYNDEIMSEIIDVYNYIKSIKEFKWMGKENNIIMAISIVVNYYSKSNELLSTTLSTCIEYIIQAQYIATIVVVTTVINSSNN